MHLSVYWQSEGCINVLMLYKVNVRIFNLTQSIR